MSPGTSVGDELGKTDGDKIEGLLILDPCFDLFLDLREYFPALLPLPTFELFIVKFFFITIPRLCFLFRVFIPTLLPRLPPKAINSGTRTPLRFFIIRLCFAST
jgi:hypothetical protein